MKTTILTSTLATLLVAGTLAAQTNTETTAAAVTTTSAPTQSYSAGRFGAGLILGEPTGASLKYWLNDTMAWDGAVGWSFYDETDLYLHSDVLWHKFDIVSVPHGKLPLYLGVGGRVKFRDERDDRLGVRVPVGATYMLDNAPVDVFLEVAPVIDFTPSTRGGFTAGIGARFWF